jgi:hypothetical protein
LVRIVGQYSRTGLVTHGHFIEIAKPNREGEITVGDTVPVPSRPGEFELQALLLEGRERHLIDRLSIVVNEQPDDG